MRLFPSKIPLIAGELVRTLGDGGDVEFESVPEADLDVQSVLKEYLRVDRELTEEAKNLAEMRGMSYGDHMKIKRQLAEKRDFGLGEEGLSWICTQISETFMQSPHVSEVFSEDAPLRRKMREVLKKHMIVDESIDAEVRQRIKNLQEGTTAWETEYSRVMDQIKRKHGIGDAR